MKSSVELGEVVNDKLESIESYLRMVGFYVEDTQNLCKQTRDTPDKERYVIRMNNQLNHMGNFLSGLEDKMPEFAEAARDYEEQKVFEAEGKNPQGISTTGGL